jgi:hypothetical protein
MKKRFFVTAASVRYVKSFTTGSINSLEDVRKSQMMPGQVRKWLSQQSKYFYAAGFDALVKQWDMCIKVGGTYVENEMLVPDSKITCFTFSSDYVLFTDSYFVRWLLETSTT